MGGVVSLALLRRWSVALFVGYAARLLLLLRQRRGVGVGRHVFGRQTEAGEVHLARSLGGGALGAESGRPAVVGRPRVARCREAYARQTHLGEHGEDKPAACRRLESRLPLAEAYHSPAVAAQQVIAHRVAVVLQVMARRERGGVVGLVGLDVQRNGAALAAPRDGNLETVGDAALGHLDAAVRDHLRARAP